MFNLTGSEIVVILLLALVVLGPEKLPDAIRRFGRTYAELRKMGTGFQQEFKAALDEPVREMRETADLIRKSADLTGDEPGGAGRKEVRTGSDHPMLQAADPSPTPTDDVPFAPSAPEDAAEPGTGDTATEAADTGAPAADAPVEVDTSDDGAGEPGDDRPTGTTAP